MGDLGDRMKRYEAAAERHLTRRVPVVVRVDGRAFHTYTRGAERPFDSRIIEAMFCGARALAAAMQGFVVGYVQSDEASFMLTDRATLATEPWFGYDHSKVVSISASTMTAAFNSRVRDMGERGSPLCRALATFDARAFSVPLDDAANYFLWRMRDWERNSVQMLAGAHFSHAELQGKNVPAMHEMLHGKGVNWADLPAQLRSGTVLTGDGDSFCPAERWGNERWQQEIDRWAKEER